MKYLLAVALLLFPSIAEAKSLGDLKFYVVSKEAVIETCQNANARACYIYPSNEIIISTDIKPVEMPFVFAHEVGHYFLRDQELALFGGDAEYAADSFAMWFLGANVDQGQIRFFNSIISA